MSEPSRGGPDRRLALVTGAARGIGRAVVDTLTERGFTVVATYLNSPEPTPPVASAHWRRCDVADPGDVEHLVDQVRAEFGTIDAFVGNAAILADGLAFRMDEEQFTRVLSVNLVANERFARLLVPHMCDRGWGRLVFVSSVGGLIGSAGQSNYAASKAALCGLAGALAVEAASCGVTVNVVAPGPIDTELLRSMGPNRIEAFAEMVPARRLGTPAEAAACVAFLCSDEASFVNGVVLPVDGGLLRADTWGRRVRPTPPSDSEG